jgi:tetratricopeptide (TPR) repeat protein
MRATAFLQRAFQHQVELKAIVSNLAQTVPDPLVLGKMYQIAIQNPTLANPIFLRMLDNCRSQDKKFRQTKYRHGLYEYALLHAAQDSLRATQISPRDARTWVRAGDCLAELKKLKESVLYYERAVELDENLEFKLRPVMERLKKSSEFLEKAKEMGWNEDTLRLALDVAG